MFASDTRRSPRRSHPRTGPVYRTRLYPLDDPAWIHFQRCAYCALKSSNMTPENATRTSEYPIPRVFTTLPYLQTSMVTFACLVLERAHLPPNAQGPSTRARQDYFNAPHTTTHWITITKLVVKPYRVTWLPH